ncbi:unnamed protein product [Lymnaea stagnalis]|uniref:Uncharacterized protein n=1 Tax=Lymnaea stagnalis TaxID=6523 RepID=A0AAV2HFQ1_LYMST
MQLEDLMAACTTIGYEPKRGGNQDTDTKSKSQKKKDLCLAMLEPDLIERDPKKDERDTAYAQYYFNRVKEVLKDDPERFRKFLTQLHDLNKDHCNPVELYADMAVLLSDHQDLVDDFGGFLLSFQAVECQCFISSLEYQQIRSFLRQLEIYCDNSTFTYQRTLKMMSKWLSLNQDAQTDCTPFRDRISAVLRHVPGLMDDLLSYFFDAPLPDSHPDDYENVELDEFYDLSETDKFEEVTLPEGREDYNTKLCSCNCHADQQDEKLQKRSRHCVSCSLKMFDGRPVLKMCRNEYHDVSVVYPLEEKEKLARAKKEAAQIALAKARAQRQQKKKNKKKKSLGKLKPKNSRKKKKIRRRNSSKLGNNLGKSSTPKDMAVGGNSESLAPCSSMINIEKDSEDQSAKECGTNSKMFESNYLALIKEEVKIKTDRLESMTDPQILVCQSDPSPDSGNGVSASNQPSLEANLKMLQSSVKPLQLTSDGTGTSEFNCKSPTAIFVSSNLSPKCGSPASPKVGAVTKTSLASLSGGPSTDLTHVSHPDALAQPVIFSVTNSLPQARFMRLTAPNVTPSIRAQLPGPSFPSSTIIGARIPVMITLQPQMSLRPSCQPSVEPTNLQKSKNANPSKSPTRRMSQKKNPKEKTSRKYKGNTGEAKEKSKQGKTVSANCSNQTEVLKSCSTDASTKLDTNSAEAETSVAIARQRCVGVTEARPAAGTGVPGVAVTSPTTPTKDGKHTSLVSGLEDTNSYLTALSRNPSLMNELQTSDTCSLFHFSPSKFKGKLPDIVRAHLENFSLGGFDESMDIHVQQLAQTISPSKLGDSTSKFDILAFLESSNLAVKETSGLSSGKNVGTADAETRLSFSGALSEMSSPVSGQTFVNPVDKTAVSVSTDVQANLSQDQPSGKEANRNEFEFDKTKLKHHEKSSSISHAGESSHADDFPHEVDSSQAGDSSQVDDIEEWTEEWDRSILNVVAVEGMKDQAIRKIQAEIPGKSAKEILSRARLLLQMLQNMGDGDSDTGTEMSCDDSSNM